MMSLRDETWECFVKLINNLGALQNRINEIDDRRPFFIYEEKINNQIKKTRKIFTDFLEELKKEKLKDTGIIKSVTYYLDSVESNIKIMKKDKEKTRKIPDLEKRKKNSKNLLSEIVRLINERFNKEIKETDLDKYR